MTNAAAQFPTIAFIGRHTDPRVAESMLVLAAHLTERGRQVIVDSAVDLPFACAVEHKPEAEFAQVADLIIAVGGDGTMLRAARIASGSHRPLLGVNRGRLGFLTDVSPAEMCDRLDDVLNGRFERGRRSLLEARLVRADASSISALALNDVVLQKGDTGRMIDFETWVDRKYVNTHGGDGIIAATATGSTAYALSCGGPIIHPDLDALVLTPICPHTLSDRPIVVPGSCSVELRLVKRPEASPQITCDGFRLGTLELGDRLLVQSSPLKLHLIHPPGHDYYKILRSKLHWGRGSHERPVGDQE
jgi:NAD+ kinase